MESAALGKSIFSLEVYARTASHLHQHLCPLQRYRVNIYDLISYPITRYDLPAPTGEPRLFPSPRPRTHPRELEIFENLIPHCSVYKINDAVLTSFVKAPPPSKPSKLAQPNRGALQGVLSSDILVTALVPVH